MFVLPRFTIVPIVTCPKTRKVSPTLARSKLYTYPKPVGTGASGPCDCRWTSLNFWNAVPDDRRSNPNYVREQLGKNYRAVPKPTQLGDVIFFLDKNDEGIHSATYIADDIVFTKMEPASSPPGCS